MPPHVRRGGTRGRSNTPRHPAQARAGLSAGRSAPRTQSKFAAFDEFCKRLSGIGLDSDCRSEHVLIGDLKVHELPTLLGKRRSTVPGSVIEQSVAVAINVPGHVSIPVSHAAKF